MSEDVASKVKCKICRGQGTQFGHWAWHNFCQEELNPVALLERIDSGPMTPEVSRLREYIIGVTGMNVQAAKAALKEERRDERRLSAESVHL